MITPAFGLTPTERVLPKLALDFTTASLNSRITFTRTTGASNPATYVDNSGYIVAATNNQPRFDYDPVTLVCKGLLIEESRVNLTTYSSDLGNAAWTKSATTVSTDVISSPDGTMNADKLIDTATTAAHFAFPAVTAVTAGTTYTASCYFKAAENTFAQLTFSTTQFGPGQYANFNLSTGSVTAQPGGTATIQNAGNGWYRCTFTAACTTSGNATCICVMLLSGTAGRLASYAGNASNGLYIWGAQLEAGAFATSYIPTTATAVTRNADVATITGTNFSDFWQASKGGVLVRARPGTVSGTRPWVQFDDGTANEAIALRGNATNPELYIVDGGVAQAQVDAGTIVANTNYSLTGSWDTNACAASINSGTPVLDGAATIPTVNQARLGSNGTNYLNGWLESIEYYDTRPTNADLQVLSSAAGYRSLIRSMINPVL